MEFRAIVKTTAWARQCASKTMSTCKSYNLASLSTKGAGTIFLSWHRVGIAWIELKPEDQNLMEFFFRPEQSPRYSTKEAAGGHNSNNILIFIWQASYPRTIWFCSRQHHYHHHIIYITFLLIIVISSLSSYLRLTSTHYKFSDSGAASHLVLPVLLLVMSSLSFRLV